MIQEISNRLNQKLNPEQLEFTTMVSACIVGASLSSIPLTKLTQMFKFFKKTNLTSLWLMIGTFVGILIAYGIRYCILTLLIPTVLNTWYFKILNRFIQSYIEKMNLFEKELWITISGITSLKTLLMSKKKTNFGYSFLLDEIDSLCKNLEISSGTIRSKL